MPSAQDFLFVIVRLRRNSLWRGSHVLRMVCIIIMCFFKAFYSNLPRSENGTVGPLLFPPGFPSGYSQT